MFPLGSPLLPGKVLPLFLFEERYLKLHSDLVDSDGRFGVVLIERGIESRDDNPTFRIGCTAQLLGSATNDDGTLSIVTIGTQRFEIIEWLDSEPYPRAEVEFLPEGPITDEAEERLSAATTKLTRLLALQSELYPGPGSPMPELDSNPIIATYQMAFSLDPQPLDAQRVLEAETADERVAVVDQILDEMIELTELQLGTG